MAQQEFRQPAFGVNESEKATTAERQSQDVSDESKDSTEQETIEVPARYKREIRERERVIKACPVKIFTSSINPRWSWPWKLNSSKEARMSTANSSEELIIDPGLYNHCYSLEAAHAAAKTDADYLLARDLPPVQYDEVDFTRERYEVSAIRVANYILEHQRLREKESAMLGQWECAHDAEVIVPIQPPYDKSLEYMSKPIERQLGRDKKATVTILDETDYIAVGGLLGFDDPKVRVEKLREVRQIVGDDMKIHALAPGTDLEIIRAIRDDHDLMDSLDVSTPEKGPAHCNIPDKLWSYHNHEFPTGADSTTVRAQFSGGIAIQFAYMLSPLCTDEILKKSSEESQQQTLGGF